MWHCRHPRWVQQLQQLHHHCWVHLDPRWVHLLHPHSAPQLVQVPGRGPAPRQPWHPRHPRHHQLHHHHCWHQGQVPGWGTLHMAPAVLAPRPHMPVPALSPCGAATRAATTWRRRRTCPQSLRQSFAPVALVTSVLAAKGPRRTWHAPPHATGPRWCPWACPSDPSPHGPGLHERQPAAGTQPAAPWVPVWGEGAWGGGEGGQRATQSTLVAIFAGTRRGRVAQGAGLGSVEAWRIRTAGSAAAAGCGSASGCGSARRDAPGR